LSVGPSLSTTGTNPAGSISSKTSRRRRRRRGVTPPAGGTVAAGTAETARATVLSRRTPVPPSAADALRAAGAAATAAAEAAVTGAAAAEAATATTAAATTAAARTTASSGKTTSSYSCSKIYATAFRLLRRVRLRRPSVRRTLTAQATTLTRHPHRGTRPTLRTPTATSSTFRAAAPGNRPIWATAPAAVAATGMKTAGSTVDRRR